MTEPKDGTAQFRSSTDTRGLRPEYVERLERIATERSVPVRNFAKRYGF
jgi:hypothetical protein